VLTFWVPLALISAALFALEHSTIYASLEYQLGNESQDLAQDVGGSNLARQVAAIAIGAMGIALLARRSQVPMELNWRLLAPIIALCAWITASALWSDDAALSLKRSLLPELLIVGAFGLAKHLRPIELCMFTAIIGTGSIMLGVAVEVVSGTFLRSGEYRFSGTLDPNIQGVYCAALCLASACLAADPLTASKPWRRAMWLMLFALGGVFLLLTQSRTSTAALIVGLVVVYALGLPWRRKVLIAGIVGPIIAAGLILLLSAERGKDVAVNAALLGRSQETSDLGTLTGRVNIWDRVIGDIAERPLTGYGYGGFWTTERVMSYTRVLDWEFNHAHSVYLESLLNAGIIGLVLGLLIVIMALASAGRTFLRTHDYGYLFIAALLALALVHGLLDSNFVIVGFAPLLGMLCIAVVVLHGGSAVRQPASTSPSAGNQPARLERSPQRIRQLETT
jgi:O-antigen ligase